MKIKSTKRHFALRNTLLKIRKRYRILIYATIVILMTIVGFLAGAVALRSGFTREAKAYLNKAINAKNSIAGLKTAPEKLYMDIKLSHLQKLRDDRERAKREGNLVTLNSEDQYVPVNLTYKNKKVDARARLKGNSLSNRYSQRLSLRIKVAGDNTIMGMQRFSLHDPVAKAYIDEWVFQRLLRYSGLPSLRYDFIELFINGESDGIYAVEESFEKRLLANNDLQEGLIIRFDEYWNYLHYISLSWNNIPERHNKVFSYSPIDAYESSRVEDDPVLREQYRTARTLLESYRLNALPMEKVFNVGDMAKLFALSDLLGQDHSLEHRNVRFYYNPVTSRLEPLGYDLHDGIRPLDLGRAIGEGKLFEYPEEIKSHILWEVSFFRDTLFFREYIKYLNEYSQEGFLEGFISSVDKDYRRSLNLIYRNNPEWRPTAFQTMKRNQEYIKRLLNPLKGMEVYLHNVRDDTLIIRAGNFHSLPLVLGPFMYRGKEIDHHASGILLETKSDYEPMKYTEIRLPATVNGVQLDPDSLLLSYGLPGLGITHREGIHGTSNYEPDLVVPGIMQLSPRLQEHTFLTVLEDEKRILFNRKTITIDRPVIIPEGYRVLCGEGTDIILKEKGCIISFSPVFFIGTQDYPITVRSEDGTGQGIAVINACDESVITYTHFKNLAGPADDGWKLDGAVTFYKSPVTIENSLFSGSRSAVALNVISSEYSLSESAFTETGANAFNSDFAKGRITGTSFKNVGASAIVLKGSTTDMDNVNIDSVKANAVEIADRSVLRSIDNSISKAGAAIVCRDDSKGEMTRTNISDCNIALIVCDTKPEYGPSQLRLTESVINRTRVSFIVEESSSLSYNQKTISPNGADYIELLQQVKTGGNIAEEEKPGNSDE